MSKPYRQAVSWLSVLMAALLAPHLGCRASASDGTEAWDGRELVGTPAPAWGDLEWIGSEPSRLEALRGRVVLIRFWTDTCPFCAASAPGFQALHERFAAEGLTVIGFYHPKPFGTVRPRDEVARAAERLGMSFPIALDQDWQTLRAFWLDTGDRAATSATFLIDRRGVIRFVHPGPELHPDGPPDHQQCRDDFASLEAAVEAVLAEE